MWVMYMEVAICFKPFGFLLKEYKMSLCEDLWTFPISQLSNKNSTQDKGVFLFLHILNEILLNIDIWKQFRVANH